MDLYLQSSMYLSGMYRDSIDFSFLVLVFLFVAFISVLCRNQVEV